VDIAALNADKTRRLSDVINTYNFGTFRPQLETPTAALQTRIGFVGEFSSGKSTLISAILGEAILPSRSAPTTANIIQIEADSDLQAAEYLSDDAGHGAQGISAAEFAALACGESQGTLRLRLPPRGILQPGIQLIDSPGINALVSGHAEITLAQLTLLDGLVVCLHCEMGTVPANVLHFLGREEIQQVAHKLLFVLTAADQKAPGSVVRVAESMAEALMRVLPKSAARPNIVVTRALDALNGDSEGIADFVRAFNTSFVARAGLLREERRASQLKHCAALIRTALRSYQQSLVYTDDEFQQKLIEGQAQLSRLRQEKSDQERRLEEWYKAFRLELQRVGERFAAVLARAQTDQVETVFAQLQAALEDVALTQIQRYAPDADIQGKPLPGELKTSLASALQAHAKYVEHGVTAATMIAVTVATAGVGAGAAAAAEAGTATAAAQTTSATALKVAAKEATKVTVKKAGQAAAESIAGQLFKSTMAQLATTIKAINPFEMVGDVVRNIWNGSETKAALPQLTARLADAYYADMVRHLDTTCFRPLQDELVAAETGMLEARKARGAGLDAFARQRDQITRDLRALDEMAAGA
jgi:hypothetical protein